MKKEQAGFSLVELLVVIAISGIIIGGLYTAIFQLFQSQERTTGEMFVTRQVQQTGYQINRDAQMARIVETDNDPDTPEVVTLTWYWYLYDPNTGNRDGEAHRVIYRIENVDELYRYYYFEIDGSFDPGDLDDPYYKTFVSENIDIDQIIYNDITLSYRVTASIEGIEPQSETRIFEVKPRPNVISF